MNNHWWEHGTESAQRRENFRKGYEVDTTPANPSKRLTREDVSEDEDDGIELFDVTSELMLMHSEELRLSFELNQKLLAHKAAMISDCEKRVEACKKLKEYYESSIRELEENQQAFEYDEKALAVKTIEIAKKQIKQIEDRMDHWEAEIMEYNRNGNLRSWLSEDQRDRTSLHNMINQMTAEKYPPHVEYAPLHAPANNP